MADRPLMIEFRHLLPIDGEGPGLAVRATPLPAREELMAVHRRDVPALVAGQRLVPLESVGDVADHVPQGLAVHQRIDAAEGVDAGTSAPRCREAGRGCRSGSRSLRLRRRVAKSVKALTKAAAVGSRAGPGNRSGWRIVVPARRPSRHRRRTVSSRCRGLRSRGPCVGPGTVSAAGGPGGCAGRCPRTVA